MRNRYTKKQSNFTTGHRNVPTAHLNVPTGHLNVPTDHLITSQLSHSGSSQTSGRLKIICVTKPICGLFAYSEFSISQNLRDQGTSKL